MKDNSYLSLNKSRIHALEEQTLPKWKSSYETDLLLKFPQMQFIIERFPSRQIKREEIIDLFKDTSNWELAAATTMIWGGLNATRSEDKSKTSLYRYLSYDSK